MKNTHGIYYHCGLEYYPPVATASYEHPAGAGAAAAIERPRSMASGHKEKASRWKKTNIHKMYTSMIVLNNICLYPVRVRTQPQNQDAKGDQPGVYWCK